MKRISVILMLLLVPILHAQTGTQSGDVSLCKPADIDATFHFSDVQVGRQEIGINLHNISSQACKVKGQLLPNFASGSHGAMISTCWSCMPDGSHKGTQSDSFVLSPGSVGHVTYEWTSTGQDCQKIDWGTFNADWNGRASFLFSFDRWKPHICSALNISGYEAGPIPGSMSPVDATLKITLPSAPVYGDERVPVTIELESPKGTVVPTGRCPDLYAVYSDGLSQRFQSIYPDDSNRELYRTPGLVGPSTPEYPNETFPPMKGYIKVCDVVGKHDTAVVTLPGSMLARTNILPTPNLEKIQHIVWRARTYDTHEPVFVTADTSFKVFDPATLAPNWGTQVQGIGAGLSVDKTRFTLGESIPVHIHWENFAASEMLAVTECGDPEPQVEVQDESHHVLHTFNIVEGCEGHGWGPFAIQTGKTHHDFVRLNYSKNGYSLSEGDEGISNPGICYLVTVWSPSILIKKTEKAEGIGESNFTFGNVYATTRSSPVRIEILPKSN